MMLLLALAGWGRTASAQPPADAEDLAAAGAGIEEILDATEAWRPRTLAWRLRATPSGTGLRAVVSEAGVDVAVNRSNDRAMRGSVEISRESWRLAFGGWRAVSSTGLLTFGGSRADPPTTAGPPVSVGGADGTDVSAWRSRPLDGWLLRRRGRGWRLLAGVGREGAERGPARLVALGGEFGAVAWEGRWLRRAAGAATGVGLAVREGGGRLWCEAAATLDRPRAAAYQAGAGWRGGGWRADLAWAELTPGFFPVAGGRSPLVPGEAGGGWAVRLGRRLSRTVTMVLMAAGGQALVPRRGPDERERRDLAELRVAAAPLPALTARIRARLRSDARDGWDGRPSWEPPASSRRVRDAGLAADLNLARADADWRLAWRGRWRDAADGARRRMLLELSREAPAPWAGLWRLRTAVAWGDDLDLVTVATPAPGAPSLRHWGRRDSESSLGWHGPLGPGDAAAAIWWSAGPEGAVDVGFVLVFQGRRGVSGTAAGF